MSSKGKYIYVKDKKMELCQLVLVYKYGHKEFNTIQ